MAQVLIIARQLVRSVPFVTPRTFNGALGAFADGGLASSVSAEFDTVDGYTDPALFNTTGTFPGVNTAKIRAVGPWLDALIWNDQPVVLRVEYAVDRACAYHAPAPDTAVAASTSVTTAQFGTVSTATNISGLRITGRFTRVTVFNNSANVAGTHPACNIEFGIYVRSA